jgi:CheY-like chemotaxis protein
MISKAQAVLLVKDNPDDEKLTLGGLERANLQNPVDVAPDGQEALDDLFGNQDQAAKPIPVVQLLDLRLPPVDGFEVLTKIRVEERIPRLPVVILTRSIKEHDFIDGLDPAANGSVCKPVRFEEFAAAIAQLGFYWLLINERQLGPAPGGGAGGASEGRAFESRVIRRPRRAAILVRNADCRAARELERSGRTRSQRVGSAQQRPARVPEAVPPIAFWTCAGRPHVT